MSRTGARDRQTVEEKKGEDADSETLYGANYAGGRTGVVQGAAAMTHRRCVFGDRGRGRGGSSGRGVVNVGRSKLNVNECLLGSLLFLTLTVFNSSTLLMS